jgi:hypothetical protein
LGFRCTLSHEVEYNAYSEYYTKLATKLLEGSDLLNEDAQKLRDNATLLDELSNKLEQKAQYFKSLADNASVACSACSIRISA